jgi:hypothetical protein
VTSSAEAHETLCRDLEAALKSAEPGSFAPVGWRLADVRLRHLMGRDLPVATIEQGGSTLSFIVTPTDPDERVYKRTRRYDVVYFSEDVPDDAQQGIYDTHGTTIDAFVAWLVGWDAASGDGT